MSQVPAVLNFQEADAKAMLACGVHLGSENVDASMKRYVFKRNDKGIHIIDIRKTWEKLVLAARVIVAIENPKDICVVALSPANQTSFAQRAVLKFSHHIGARSIAGKITPGTFTNQQQNDYMEPRILVTSDPRNDHQPIIEASYVNIPVISFVNSHDSLRGIDIGIPCNTAGKYSVAYMYWLLAREVLRMRDLVSRDQEWNVLVDMFIYREPEEAEKQPLPGEYAEKPTTYTWGATPAEADVVPGEEGTGEWGGDQPWAESGTGDTSEWVAEDGGQWDQDQPEGEVEGDAGNW